MVTPSPIQRSGGVMRLRPQPIIGILAFAALMALRYEVASVVARAFLAACAFAVLAFGVLASQKRRA